MPWEKKEEGKEHEIIEKIGVFFSELQGTPLHEMLMLWEKISDSDRKTLLLRRLDEAIMKKEYKVETLKMIKTMIEKT